MSPAATLPLTQHLHITCFHIKQFSNSHFGSPVRPQLALASTNFHHCQASTQAPCTINADLLQCKASRSSASKVA